MLDAMLVPNALMFPNRCIDGSQDGPVIDTHVEIGDERVYVSRRQAVEHGRLVGMVDAAAYAKVAAELAAATERVRELETELAEAEPILRSLARAEARYRDVD